jgi:enoyl-CoA hydratase
MGASDVSSDHITTTIRDGVATIVLDRPEALNALTSEMLSALATTLDALATDDAVEVIVLTGAGRAFSAGVDLKALGTRRLDGGKVGDVLDVPARAVTSRLTSISKLVIAKVNGFCFTGALELVLACDLSIAAETAKIGDTHAKFGLRPTWGMSQRLVATIGITRARELSYTARTFTGSDAAAWGLVTRAVPADELDRAVAELVAEVKQNSMGSLAAYKDLYRTSLDVGLAEGLGYETATEYDISDTETRIAGFR